MRNVRPLYRERLCTPHSVQQRKREVLVTWRDHSRSYPLKIIGGYLVNLCTSFQVRNGRSIGIDFRTGKERNLKGSMDIHTRLITSMKTIDTNEFNAPWYEYYKRFWMERWALARPHMCKYCSHRLDCLIEEEFNTMWCTEAWNKLVNTEGPQF
jgi:hypothetical protein